ncbi:hypothetical protein K435DRAFT_969574 [Dendrothele bispora CBS 962.96]|uniref:Uncharacterized protein n=1 Tax=Dendrothele bispora (strain CBS 962.96) TaxID=1314807 RepID=A0A4S8LI10_DENBC|nr:hypothetical protein K435DRAFT_969574 [Dendrothele bispora CBS 962.96]
MTSTDDLRDAAALDINISDDKISLVLEKVVLKGKRPTGVQVEHERRLSRGLGGTQLDERRDWNEELSVADEQHRFYRYVGYTPGTSDCTRKTEEDNEEKEENKDEVGLADDSDDCSERWCSREC